MSLLRGKTNNTFDVISGDFNGESLPVGAMIPFPSDTIPYGWLLCNGQAVSRIDYSELFAVLGTTHGTGDGSTTFNVPDMRDYTVVGKSSTDTNINTIGKKYGSKTHTLTVEELANHNHALGLSSGGSSTGWGLDYTAASPTYRQYKGIDFIDNEGGGQAHNNMQPSIAENYIIKAKQSSGVVAQVVDDLESTSTVDALSANQGKVLNEKINKVLLWTNPDSNVAFSASNNITDVSGYKMLIVDMKVTVSDNTHYIIQKLNDNLTTRDTCKTWTSSYGNILSSRDIFISNNKLCCGEGYYFGIGASSVEGQDNEMSVPYKVYGFKE